MFMKGSEETTNPQMLQHMAQINQLNVKAFNAETVQALTFIILNDTVTAIRYNRAVLWEEDLRKPKILGVSGQVQYNKDALLTKHWQQMHKGIEDRRKPQIITKESLSSDPEVWDLYQSATPTTVIWLPIFHENELVLGLWLEIFGTIKSETSVDETLKFLNTYLTPAYGAAWAKLKPKYSFKHKNLGKKQILIALAAFLLCSVIIRIPLRVIAPCEVIANNPVLITAPLDGIIDELAVKPGDLVKKSQTIVEYNKQVPLRNLKVAQKEVEILQAEINRANALGVTDPKSRTELGILNLKLEKEQQNLQLARWQASQLTITAPSEGIIMSDNPENWRGKPVQVGEKILSINNPNDTKVRIWIPESDNIILETDEVVKVFLNIQPEKSYGAKIYYIASESILSADNLPSFVAEANWVKQPEDVKLGLKGTAILYGQNVSLLYYLVRKPWAKVRSFIGY